MAKDATLVLQYDAPDEADDWFHGPHYAELRSVPGVVSAHRYKLTGENALCRKYLVIIECDDIDATLAWRNSADGQRSQAEANRHGVTNRVSAVYRCVCAVSRD
jgi:uncharacterized protein (DUF1330 family)